MRKEKLEIIKEVLEKYRIKSEFSVENTKTRFLSIGTKTFRLANGTCVTREYLKKKNPNAVIIIPETIDHEYVLIIEPRPIIGGGSIDFPAGYIENGEESIVAAKRELEEETGYVPKEIEELGYYFQDHGCSPSKNTVVYAKGCQEIGTVHWDQDEEMTKLTVTYQELMYLKKHHYFHSSNMLVALSFLEEE